MKAIILDQSWAELNLPGCDTIELRTPRPGQLGRLAQPAIVQALARACARFGLDPEGPPKGALAGTVMAAEVIHFDQALCEATRDRHLSDAYKPGCRAVAGARSAPAGRAHIH